MSEFEKVRQYLASAAQLCYARLSRLEEGSGHGQRIVDVNNGSGLAFTVTPDRGMNIVECSFKGVPVAFRAPAGHRRVSGNWLKDWSAGLLTTCGLRNIGSPSGTQALHGEIAAESAEQVGCFCRNGEIEVTGTLYEGAMFNANLTQVRTIRTAYGSNRIEISDTVTNNGEFPEFTEILYHFNLGYPLVSPDLEFDVPEHKVEPRNDAAAAAVDSWNNYPQPLEGFNEFCYRHYLPADEKGWATMRIKNRTAHVALNIHYDTSTLPLIVQWKKPSKNAYVLGLEPTNGSLNGCEFDKENGFGKVLAPGESISYRVVIEFDEC
jgi:hypothetical protein